MEIKIYNSNETNPLVKWNYDELKTSIASAMEKYEGLVVTEETLQVGKKTKADLRRFVTMIEDTRKEVKRRYAQPYEQFEKQVKELESLVEAQITAIDSQVKEFDNARKVAKRAEIVAYFNTGKDKYGIGEWLTFESIEDSKWSNLSTSIMAVYESIDLLLSKIASDEREAKKMENELPGITDYFYKCRNYYEAYAKATEDKKRYESLLNAREKEAQPAEKQPKEEPAHFGKKFEIFIRVNTTFSEAKALRNYLTENNYEWELLEN